MARSSKIRRENIVRYVFLLFIVLGLLTCTVYAETGDAKASGERMTLIVGFSSKVFYDVAINDAKAATKVWMDVLIKKQNLFEKSDTIVYPDLSSIEKAVRAKTVDVMTLLPQEYLEIRKRVSLEPVFVADHGKDFYHQFLLIVRADRGINQLTDLKNKKLALETSQNGTIPIVWLETLIMKEGYTTLKAFFSNVKDAQKTSQALLPVFFRQTDAAIVSRSSFDVMVELNPQLGKELKVIATSPKLLAGIVCIRKDLYKTNKDAVNIALESLQSDPQGKQILTLFRINRLVPFNPSHLETIEALLKEHRDSSPRYVNRK